MYIYIYIYIYIYTHMLYIYIYTLRREIGRKRARLPLQAAARRIVCKRSPLQTDYVYIYIYIDIYREREIYTQTYVYVRMHASMRIGRQVAGR